MEETTTTKTDIKAKISFSVESLLSKKPVEEDERVESEEESRLDESSEIHDEDDEENITVDDEDTDGRDSLSPTSPHTVLIPQPLHPSLPRILSGGGHPQWPFSWVGHPGMMRSSSPQSEFRNISYRQNSVPAFNHHFHSRYMTRKYFFLLSFGFLIY